MNHAWTEELYPEKTSAIARDLRLNLQRVIEEGALDPTEAFLTLLSVATSIEDRPLSDFARNQLERMGTPAEQITEAAESAAIVGMLNIYYRFRHMIAHGRSESIEESADPYRIAGLRMMSIARPALGKARFEMLAFAISVLNGCEACIQHHEKKLRDEGVDTGKIHDIVRLASITQGLKTLGFATSGPLTHGTQASS